MKILSQYCSNVPIFMLHSFGLVAAQVEVLDWFLLVLQQHGNIRKEHDSNLYFHIFLSWQK